MGFTARREHVISGLASCVLGGCHQIGEILISVNRGAEGGKRVLCSIYNFELSNRYGLFCKSICRNCRLCGRALIFINCELYSGLARTSGNGR